MKSYIILAAAFVVLVAVAVNSIRSAERKKVEVENLEQRIDSIKAGQEASEEVRSLGDNQLRHRLCHRLRPASACP